VRRFLLWLAVCGLTVIAVNSALAKGGPLHLFPSQLPSASQAGVPAKQPISPSETFGGCGRGRYRDPHTNRCRGPADVGN
jgi:hypothetical protein